MYNRMNAPFPTFDLLDVRQSIAAGVVPKTSPAALSQALEQGRNIAVVDVRKAEDFAKGHVPGAVNLPPDQWNEATGLSKDKVAVVYCYNHTCPLGGAACAELAGRGYPVVEMDGGFDVWQASELMPDS
jgi:ArsR family transcriptional regulator